MNPTPPTSDGPNGSKGFRGNEWAGAIAVKCPTCLRMEDWRALLGRLYPWLLEHARTHSDLDDVSAQFLGEICMGIFVQKFPRIIGVNGERSYQAFLKKTFHHQVLDWLKKHHGDPSRKTESLETPGSGRCVVAVADPGLDPSESFAETDARQDRILRVRAAMLAVRQQCVLAVKTGRECPGPCRLLCLRDAAGLTFAEMGAQLGLKRSDVPKVRAWYWRCRKAFVVACKRLAPDGAP